MKSHACLLIVKMYAGHQVWPESTPWCGVESSVLCYYSFSTLFIYYFKITFIGSLVTCKC